MTDVLPLFKALADETRIKVAALLLERDMNLEELSSTLDVPLRIMARHLGNLQSVGLVEKVGETRPPRYRFRPEPLREALHALPSSTQSKAIDEDAPESDQKILSTFMAEGKLNSIPAQAKKRDVILRFLARRFETDRMYDEREVNEILREYHNDVASLRRYLVDGGLLRRQIVRVAAMQELMEGTPSMQFHVAYWKPAPEGPEH